MSDLHLPLRDHSIHLVSHRAVLRWSKQPPLPRAALPAQHRPLRCQLPALQASGAQRPPHFRRALMASRFFRPGRLRDCLNSRALPAALSHWLARAAGGGALGLSRLRPGASRCRPRFHSQSGRCWFLSLDAALLNFRRSGFRGNPLRNTWLWVLIRGSRFEGVRNLTNIDRAALERGFGGGCV